MKTKLIIFKIVMLIVVFMSCKKDEEITNGCNIATDLGEIAVDGTLEEFYRYEGIEKLYFKNQFGEEEVYTLVESTNEFIPVVDSFYCENTSGGKAAFSYEKQIFDYIFRSPSRYIYFSSGIFIPQDVIKDIQNPATSFFNTLLIDVGVWPFSDLIPICRDCCLSINFSNDEVGRQDFKDQILDSLILDNKTYYDVLQDPPSVLNECVEYSELSCNKQYGLFSFIEGENLWILEKME